MPVEPTRLLLLRHGESTWNEAGRWQGRADPALTRRGRSEANQAAEALARMGPWDLVVSSPLRRALETAEILVGSLATGAEPLVLDWMVERRAGPWEGLTRAEIERDWPGFLAEHRRPEGFEDDESVRSRAIAGLAELARRFPGSTILGIGHGGVIGQIEAHLGAGRAPLANLGGRWLRIEPGETARIAVDGPRLKLVELAASAGVDYV